MRITQLRIDRFGVWSGLEVDQLTAPIVVFYGENEAGKTTLMQFVRTVLYGFSAARRERYVPPRSARPGGSMAIEVAGQSLVVHRHLDPPSGEELLEVVDHDDQHHPVRSLTRLLDGVDEPVFNGVFAFGLREIQELATLSDSTAADLLYELTLGIDRVSLSDVVGHLDTGRSQLLGDGEHPGRLLELVERREPAAQRNRGPARLDGRISGDRQKARRSERHRRGAGKRGNRAGSAAAGAGGDRPDRTPLAAAKRARSTPQSAGSGAATARRRRGQAGRAEEAARDPAASFAAGHRSPPRRDGRGRSAQNQRGPLPPGPAPGSPGRAAALDRLARRPKQTAGRRA